jgi:hypothetical protein
MRIIVGILAVAALAVALVAAATRRFQGRILDVEVNHPALCADEPSRPEDVAR